MLPMQLEVSDIWPSSIYIKEPPPICKFRQCRARIFVKSVVEIIAEQVSHSHNDQSNRPIIGNDGYD